MRPFLKLLAVFFSAAICLQAAATTRYVSTTGDNTNNDCTDVNNACGTIAYAIGQSDAGDTVQVAAGTYTEYGIAVNINLTVNGHSAKDTIVQAAATEAAATDRVFKIGGGTTVTIAGLTIANGHAGNDHGGGIYNDHAMLTVANCTLRGNTADGFGGGIFSYAESGNASLTVNNSTLSGNTGVNFGGGIANRADGGWTASVTVNNSTLDSNSVTIGDGGGIFNVSVGGTASATVTNSTFSGNSANENGGGIVNRSGLDGIANLTVNNSTFAGNSAQFAGGIFNYLESGQAATLTIGSTILKAGASGENIANSGGTVTSSGYNLSSDDQSTLLNQPTDQNSTDPLLDPAGLQDNGGPTFTIALEPGSPAIDKGKNFTTSTTDQRGPGFPRTVDRPSTTNAAGGDGTDIGAFELQEVCNTTFTLKPAATLWPPNHKYHTFTVAQMVQSATDDCDGDITNQVVIEQVTSDEVENAPGNNDGNTLNDIVIASNCKSVQLRSERDEKMNGRVYLVTLRVSDTSGNVTRATYKISVPIGNKGTAVDSGVHYTVNSNCHL